MKRADIFLTVLLVPLDFLFFILAGATAYALRTSSFVAGVRPVLFDIHLPFSKYLEIVSLVGIALIVVFAISGLYEIKRRGKLLDESFKIFIAVSAVFASFIIYIFFRRELFDSRFLILAVWFFVIIYAIFVRILIRLIYRVLAMQFQIGVDKILIIGNDGVAKNIISAIGDRSSSGYKVMGHFIDLDLGRIKDAISQTQIDEIILTNFDLPREKILELIDLCGDNYINFKFVPNFFQILTANAEVETLAGLPIIELKKTSLGGWGKVFKRVFDIIFSLIGLIILSPLFIIIAILVKLDSRGPVFARLKRVSRNKEFILYKFRSMATVDPDGSKPTFCALNERGDGPLFKMKNDPRVTKLGKLTRKTRLDELPQLFNVLRGEMSLIGPRPHQPNEIAQYARHHKKLLTIKAGITGMAQISGSSDLLFEEEVRLDTYYIENWSIWLDVKILLKTFLVVFTDRSAC